MTDPQLLEYSQQVKVEADHILQELATVGIKTGYDSFAVIGSYAYNLMYDRDLDMILRTKDPTKTARDLCHSLIDCGQFARIEFDDVLNYPKKGRPKGFIICLFIQILSYPIWEIGLWIVDEPHQDIFDGSKTLCGLPVEKKIAVLRDKHNRSIKRISKKDLPSVQIYTQHLRTGYDNRERHPLKK